MLTLWDYGFLPAARELEAQGIPAADLEREMERVRPAKRQAPSEGHALSLLLSALLEEELGAAWAEDNAPEHLPERTSKTIKEFKVIFRSNESQHRGFPHVVVVLHGLEVSMSLEDPPRVLAPHGLIRGVSAALKVISANRKKLINEWKQSRPDDQKLLDS